MWTRITLAAVVAAVGLATAATSASALSLGIGTTASFANFQPGRTATGTGSLIATALPPWTLTVADLGSGAGRMVTAAAGCTGSDPQMANALTVAVTGGGISSAGSKAISATATLDRQACPDRSFALYDVARASLDESPLRIVGFVAPTGTVTIDADGGTAHFNGPTGAHRVTLLTANDEGVAGPVVTATITVR